MTEAAVALGVALVLAAAQWIRESTDRRARRAGRRRTRQVDREGDTNRPQRRGD